ncbi:MAG: FAD-dependent monooxygenase [Calothrix sp. MO_167.B42]|nr:FAD-dependent monooxygenase [Calothrix sp. MO_167.B42]
MASIHSDVIIVGRGIAGLCLSVLLQRKGIEHFLVVREMQQKVMALAETLPPSALAMIQQLGLREVFESSALEKTFGYHSLWGSSQIQDINFYFQHPYNYGLKLDKQLLLGKLEGCLDSHRTVQCKDWYWKEEDRCIRVNSAEKVFDLRGRVFVDATGRKQALLRKLGIGSTVHDQQIAFSCHLPRIRHPKIKHGVFTEAFKGGWGIVSSLDQRTNVMTLYAEKGSPQSLKMREFHLWPTLLSSTQILQAFLAAEVGSSVLVSAANSICSNEIAGSDWLALGDAAIAFDPLSSHGIANAVYTAWQGAEAIEECLGSDSDLALGVYSEKLRKIFGTYLATRQRFYNIYSSYTSTQHSM